MEELQSFTTNTMSRTRDWRRALLTVSSAGNHAQALALAAKTYGIPAHIVMPRISTTSKIAGTQRQGANVIFSGSTSDEREAAVADVVAKTGAILIPPYDHPDIMLGQGTLALELEEQVQTLLKTNPDLDINSQSTSSSSNPEEDAGGHLDAIITTCGGGGMLSGLCTAMSGTGVHVFGAEPRHQGANDAERGLAARPPTRITRVKSLTVADGARTPVGLHPWGVISDAGRCAGVYSADEEQIALALRLAMERAKLFIEPTAALPLAVVLFNEAFRRRVVELLEQRNAAAGRDGRTPRKGWNLGVVLSGGNTTMEALAKIFGEEDASGKGGRREVDGGDRARL
jgi:threonine dehydratase